MAELETPTPAEGAETPADEKVTFTRTQQAKIEEIVKKVSARAGAEARAETARLKAELEAQKTAAPPAVPDTGLELATTKAELKALKDAQTESSLRDALRAAAGDLFVDGELGCRLMRDSVKIGADGKPYVVGADGNPVLGADFEPLGLRDLAQQIANQKPFLARGTTKAGTGSYASNNQTSSQPRLEDIFGRTSSGMLANKLAMANPTQYRLLKARAREKGLI